MAILSHKWGGSMIILSLIFLAFICMNIISNSMRTKRIDKYIKDIEKDLPKEFNTVKIKE